MNRRPHVPHFIAGIGDGTIHNSDSQNNNNNNKQPPNNNDDISLDNDVGGDHSNNNNNIKARYMLRHHSSSQQQQMKQKSTEHFLHEKKFDANHWKTILRNNNGFASSNTRTATITNENAPSMYYVFLLLGMIIMFSALFLHFISDGSTHSNQSNNHYYTTSSNQRRRHHQQRQRRMNRNARTTKKKTDEWSEDEEQLQDGARIFVASSTVASQVMPNPGIATAVPVGTSSMMTAHVGVVNAGGAGGSVTNNATAKSGVAQSKSYDETSDLAMTPDRSNYAYYYQNKNNNMNNNNNNNNAAKDSSATAGGASSSSSAAAVAVATTTAAAAGMQSQHQQQQHHAQMPRDQFADYHGAAGAAAGTASHYYHTPRYAMNESTQPRYRNAYKGYDASVTATPPQQEHHHHHQQMADFRANPYATYYGNSSSSNIAVPSSGNSNHNHSHSSNSNNNNDSSTSIHQEQGETFTMPPYKSPGSQAQLRNVNSTRSPSIQKSINPILVPTSTTIFPKPTTASSTSSSSAAVLQVMPSLQAAPVLNKTATTATIVGNKKSNKPESVMPPLATPESSASSSSRAQVFVTTPTSVDPPDLSHNGAAEPRQKRLSFDATSLPATPEDTQLAALNARPLGTASNFSSFASDSFGGESINLNSSNSTHQDNVHHDHQQTSSSHHGISSSSHHHLLLSPGNAEETPRVGNTRKTYDDGRRRNHHIIDLCDGLQIPSIETTDDNDDKDNKTNAGGGQSIPFLPHLEYMDQQQLTPPRSLMLNDLKLQQMETGNSTHWEVCELPSNEVNNDAADNNEQKKKQSTTAATEEAEVSSTTSSFASETSVVSDDDITIPSNDPHKNIRHVRPDLTMSTDAGNSLKTKIHFNELTLHEVIGGGGFGQIWKATWRGTPVAVKVLTGSAQGKRIAKSILQEFKAEINLLKGMRHPNICLYMGACFDPPNRAIITELAANGSVWDALRLPLCPPYVPADGTARGSWPIELYVPDRHGAPPSNTTSSASSTASPKSLPPIPPKGTWPWELVKRVALGAAQGMAYLHSGDPPVLHRDLKSANLLLTESYTAKVCDFGLSRLKSQERSMTGNCGTVQWMAPEVLANMKYNEKADIYSFGIICWELLSRQCPYDGMSAIQCALAVLNRDKRPEIPKWCPPPLQALIRSCIKKDPTQRPTFEQIILALLAMP